MNQRIRELNLQAMSIVMNGSDPDGDVEQMYIPSEFTKKFAELIVRECTQSIENTIETDCITDGEKMGCEFAILDLLKHFGVEE